VTSDPIDAVIALLRARIDALQGAGGALVREIAAHHFGWAGEPDAMGKLVRPRLCLLPCRAVGGDPMIALPAAAAIELIHNYSLIHDDIEDRDEMRRGRSAAWKAFGDAQAINAGDCIHSLAFAAMDELDATRVAPECRLRAIANLSEANVRLCEGQAHDIALQSREDLPNEDEYLDMVTRKTGALMRAAASIGALLGGADWEYAGAFGQFGERLGVAFQIRDDVLGIWGDPEQTGKPAGADLTRKRCSYPVVWASARAEGKDREALLGVRADPSAKAVAGAIAALERLGAREHAEELAAEMHRQAWAALEGLKLEPRAEAELRQLTEFLTIRDR
jgi:geranylgeranyl diphosphate synthase type I